MSLAITDDVTLEDIDEAIKHIYGMLKTDEFGNRMNWRKKELLPPHKAFVEALMKDNTVNPYILAKVSAGWQNNN